MEMCFGEVRVKNSACWWCWYLCVGIIKLRRSPPPRLRGPQYVLNITATDDNASGGPFSLSSSTQVIVGINDINNNKPVFQEVTELWKVASEKFPTAVKPQIVSLVSELQSKRRGSGKPAARYTCLARPGPWRWHGREWTCQVRHHAQRRHLTWLWHRSWHW